jgi:hypothetical protein
LLFRGCRAPVVGTAVGNDTHAHTVIEEVGALASLVILVQYTYILKFHTNTH